MALGDLVGLYGALLASALAFIQYRQWRESSDKLSISLYDEYAGPPFHVEVTITNLSSSTAYLKFIGIGVSYRTWLRPWKRLCCELVSLNATEDGYLTGKNFEGALSAGQSVDVYADSKTCRHIETRPTLAKGFSWKWIIEVEHSLPGYRSARVMTWPMSDYFSEPRVEKKQ
jgi:hypothetical protein